jgi:RNA polymerase sigma-70 factor (ECF subfamily)
MNDQRPTPIAEDEGEAALVAGLRAGDAAAYEEMVRRHLPRMLATARRVVGNEEDARDAIQDAFLSAFRALDSFEGQSRLSTWLHRIAVNAALMKLRSKRRRPERPITDLLPRFTEDGHQAEPAAPWPGVERMLVAEETRAVVRQAIDQLPEGYRTVLVLRDIEGMDTEETARQLEVGEGVVKTRLHRARQALRALLDPLFRGGNV